jgi:hypothetical protein
MTSPKIEAAEYTVTRQYFDNAIAAAREEGARKAIASLKMKCSVELLLTVDDTVAEAYNDGVAHCLRVIELASIPKILKEKP